MENLTQDMERYANDSTLFSRNGYQVASRAIITARDLRNSILRFHLLVLEFIKYMYSHFLLLGFFVEYCLVNCEVFIQQINSQLSYSQESQFLFCLLLLHSCAYHAHTSGQRQLLLSSGGFFSVEQSSYTHSHFDHTHLEGNPGRPWNMTGPACSSGNKTGTVGLEDDVPSTFRSMTAFFHQTPQEMRNQSTQAVCLLPIFLTENFHSIFCSSVCWYPQLSQF